MRLIKAITTFICAVGTVTLLLLVVSPFLILLPIALSWKSAKLNLWFSDTLKYYDKRERSRVEEYNEIKRNRKLSEQRNVQG